MKTVWKFTADDRGTFVLSAPEGKLFGSVVHFDVIGTPFGQYTLWIEVYDELSVSKSGYSGVYMSANKRFFVVGTGMVISNDDIHVKSTSTDGGAFIWHLYEDTY